MEREWLSTWRTDFRFGDDYKSSLFSLYAAMKMAERFRWTKDYERKKHQRLRRWLRLDRLAYRWLEWWLDRHYPPARTPHFLIRPRVKASERNAAQWQRMVEAQAKKRLDDEGREPLRVTDY